MCNCSNCIQSVPIVTENGVDNQSAYCLLHKKTVDRESVCDEHKESKLTLGTWDNDGKKCPFDSNVTCNLERCRFTCTLWQENALDDRERNNE